MSTPLKIRDVAGNIQELTDAEENYLTYLIGTHLAADSANGIGGITTNSGHTSIGSYTNTFFNEPVGTHPGTSITSGSTITTLYQNQGTAASETDSDVEIPLMWVDAGGQTGFKQMPAADLNTAVDRYLTKLFTNDYPGVFKLGSASPGPDYSTWLSSVFTDTRTDGTSVVYNIYRRDSYTIPTEIPPMYVRDSGGFDGIQAMTDRKIKYSFGQRAKSRIGASKIGTYQLRSSTDGAPTDPGTWISAGAATDTKQTTSQQQFTSVFTAQYDKGYTRAYTRVFSGNYTQTYVSSKNIGYTGAAFAALYSKSFLRQQSESFGRNYTRVYTGNYTRTYTRAYTPNYVKRYTGNYVRNYVRAYSIGYTSTGPAAYDPSTYLRDTVSPTGSLLVNIGPVGGTINLSLYTWNDPSIANAPATSVIGEAQAAYGSLVQPIMVGTYTGITNYENSRGTDFLGPYPFVQRRTPAGPAPSPTPPAGPQTLGLVSGVLYGGSIGEWDVVGTRYWPLVGMSLQSFTGQGVKLAFAPPTSAVYQWGAKWHYEGLYRIPYVTDNAFIPYGNTYIRQGNPYIGGAGPGGTLPPSFAVDYSGAAQLYVRDMGYLNRLNQLSTKPGWYTREILVAPSPFGGGVAGFKLYLGAAAGDVTVLHPEILQYNMERFFGGNPGGIDETLLLAAGVGYMGGYTSLATSQYVRAFSANFATNYVSVTDVGYVGNAFNAPYATNFIRNTNIQYLRNYTGIYSSVYTGAYDKLYTPNYITTYTGNYDIGYVSAYTSLFNTTYLTGYVRAYTGNFEGLTIDATDETNETYTLYVRIS